MMRNRHDVFINDEQENMYVSFKLIRLLKYVINIVLDYIRSEKPTISRRCEVSVTLTDNEGITVINYKYRNIDKPTDVLSFPMNDDTVLGDIVISIEKALQQANEYSHSFEREVSFLCIHGMLHLLGYDHEISQNDENIMFQHQKNIMELLRINK